MTTKTLKKLAGASVAVIAATTLLADAGLASAQPYGGPDNGYNNNGYNNGPPPGYSGDNNGPPPGYNGGYGDNGGGYPSDMAPPSGQYAEPPPGYENGGAYDNGAQQADQEYAARYSAWAAQNCINQRNNNTAAGAIVGGVLGAVVGAGIAGGRNAGAGALVGGALGAGTGAAIGSSSTPGGCPPGYYIRAGAPAFYWGGPAVVTYAPGWYHPWVWAGGRWTYRPYRSWYWAHRGYWRPGWRGHPYRRW